ncbi:MAG: biotin/lipoyl-containing protein, partial [Geminicoccaceae bacterium]
MRRTSRRQPCPAPSGSSARCSRPSGSAPMATEVVMPRLSDSMEEGTILEWLVADGAQVASGEPLAEIETDKANMVFEADIGGLVKHVAQVGDTLPVGALIARILISGGRSPDSSEAHANGGGAGPSSLSGPAADAPETTPPPSSNGPDRAKASPLARRIASEHDLDLDQLEGSGPGGRVVKADVERQLASGSAPTAASASPTSPGGGGGSAPSPAQAGIASPLIPGKAPPAADSPPVG